MAKKKTAKFASPAPASYDNVADVALLADGRAGLAPELQADHDRIVEAFRLVETGQDAAARESLQGVGLRSPFLEWKLLLRGLQAYYANDDARARENWQRLDPRRLPARLVAPFRAAIEPEYLAAQPARAQPVLRQQLENLQSDAILTHLRTIRQALANRDSIAPAFRAAEALLPLIKADRPHLVARLARCFYGAILRYGPDELPRYRRVFGNPPDDVTFHRLQAFGYESGGEWQVAHEMWQAYEKEIAAQPQRWPGEEGTVARALIWQRMGDNAANVPTAERIDALPRFLRNFAPSPKPLKPSTEKCFKRSLELAPQLLAAHEGLFQHYLGAGKNDNAVMAGEALLKQVPDHLDTLRALATLHVDCERYDEAVAVLERALRHNPLDRLLRMQMGDAQLRLARHRTEQGKFDESRALYPAALAYLEPEAQGSVYARWAACELKAGDEARADELLAEARSRMPGELVLTFMRLVETIRLRLSNTLKTKLTREFNAAIEQTPTPAIAVALLTYASELARLPRPYFGQQTHVKKVIAYAMRLAIGDFTEQQLVRLLLSLNLLKAGSRLLSRNCAACRLAYPDNPRFYYLEAIHLMGDDPEDSSTPHWRIDDLLREAEERAMKRLQQEPDLRNLLDDIKRRRQLMQTLNPFLGRLESMFDSMGGSPFDDED